MPARTRLKLLNTGYGNNFGVFANVRYSFSCRGNRNDNANKIPPLITFQAYSCAFSAGTHFVAVNNNINKPERGKLTAFEWALPTLRVHPNPETNRSKASLILRECLLSQEFPWEGRRPSSWSGHIADIASVIYNASDAYLQSLYGINPLNYTLTCLDFDLVIFPHNGTVYTRSMINNTIDGMKAKVFPLLGEVVIIFRCVDVIMWGGDNYGFLNFNTYSQLIPKNVKTIYVNSEELFYNPNNQNKENFRVHTCEFLGIELLTFLHSQYPNATIAMRRGHPHDSILQITRAQIVISPPSTFSLWAGLGNARGNVYFYLSPLLKEIYEQGPESTKLAPNFHWITHPSLVSLVKSPIKEQSDLSTTPMAFAALLKAQAPSVLPTFNPTPEPSSPSSLPTIEPTGRPSRQPITRPSIPPSSQPSRQPLAFPSIHPSNVPMSLPSAAPSNIPSLHPILSPPVQHPISLFLSFLLGELYPDFVDLALLLLLLVIVVTWFLFLWFCKRSCCRSSILHPASKAVVLSKSIGKTSLHTT